MGEVEKILKFLVLSSGQRRGREMLIILREYCNGLQVSKTEVNRRKNDSKGK